MNKVAPGEPALLQFDVRKLWNFIFYWGPIIAWMALIFCGSGNGGSFEHSSRIIEPLLHWLAPGLSHDQVNEVVFAVRKCAHVSEYGLLVLLVWRALRGPGPHEPRPWNWPRAAEAFWVAVLYAATDEFHQTFVPSREGCLRDVGIDSLGAMAGLALLWFFFHRRKLRNSGPDPNPGQAAPSP